MNELHLFLFTNNYTLGDPRDADIEREKSEGIAKVLGDRVAATCGDNDDAASLCNEEKSARECDLLRKPDAPGCSAAERRRETSRDVTDASRDPTNAGDCRGAVLMILLLVRNEYEEEPSACTAARAPPTAPNKSCADGDAK